VKPNPNESYESWCERVRMFEHGHAMMQIAQGKDADKVMEEMGRRIMDKLLYPIFKAIRDDVKPFDIEASRRSYEENYLKTNKPKAEHIDDTLT
jgi:glutamyl-tRNA reductase